MKPNRLRPMGLVPSKRCKLSIILCSAILLFCVLSFRPLNPTCQLEEESSPPGSPEGRPIQFIHIPKAGGTSVNSLLHQFAKDKGYAFTHFYFETARKSIAVTPGVRPSIMINGEYDCPLSAPMHGIFTGHRQIGFCRRLLQTTAQNQQKMFYIGVFREPISRFVSEVDYMLRRLEVFGGPLRSETLVQQYWVNKNLSDVVEEAYRVRKQPSVGVSHAALQSANKIFELCHLQTRLMGFPLQKDVSMLQQALNNLNKLDVVAVREHLYDDLNAQFRFLLPQMKDVSLPVENENTKFKSTLSPLAQKIIQIWSRDDIVLYQHAFNRSRELTARARMCLQ